MTDDLTDRLRLAAKPEEIASVWGLTVVRCSLLREAADEIDRLRAWVKDLQKLAGPFPLAVNLDGDDANERLAEIVEAWNKEPRRDADLRIVTDD